MPIDGQQQVYGAQHPPSVKLIKELKSNASSGNSGGMTGGYLSNLTTTLGATTGAGVVNVGNAFKDFEKKTIDAWDIDDGDADGTVPGAFGNFLNENFPISLADSEEVAKKIIKNHRDQQQISNKPTKLSTSSALSNKLNTSSSSNGPGKALRQELNANTSSNKTTASSQEFSTLTNTFKTVSISSDVRPNQLSNSSANVKTSSSTSTSNQVREETSSNGSNASSTNTKANAKADESASSPPSLPSNNSNSSTGNNFNLTSSSSSSSPNSKPSVASKYSFSHIANRDKEDELIKMEKFRQILNTNPINLDELQKASWKGIPKAYRPTCWKLLSDYLPLNHELQEKTVEQKRNSYWEAVNIHYTNTYLESHHEILRQILNDIPRMNPLLPIFQNKIIQDIFQRVLYVWAVRHPGSGYVQGINDLLTPFFVVFLTEYSETEIQSLDIESLPQNNLKQLEADCYWCMNKLLERIQENYVCSQPGIQRNIRLLEYLVKRIDANLYNHLKKNHIEFIQFAFRWMNNLLMREIPLNCTIRLWDTYHAEPFGFSDFHLYVCAAFLLRFSKNLIEEKDFQGLMMTLQNLPTKNMKASDVELLTAEAYQLQVMFANSPNHTSN